MSRTVPSHCTLLLVMALAACARAPEADVAVAATQPEATAPTSPTARAQDPAWPPFTIRGRWSDSRSLRYRIDESEGPMPRTMFEAAVERAIARWNATGCVQLTAAVDASADVVLGWRQGAHDACEPLGASGAIAHAGPVASPTFVHFDGKRAFRPDGTGPLSLESVALHELGHVLGLDHVEDASAALSSDPARPCAVGDGDLAGLRSLYGGGDDDASDLRILGADGSVRAILRRVAPADRTAFAAFDTDGDNRDELLVWRTDPAGHGALMVFGFWPGPSLAQSKGPFVGAVAPGARCAAVVTDHGERLLVSELPNGRRTALSFSDSGALEPFAGDPPPVPGDAARDADFDGDGVRETVVRTDR